MGNGFLSFTGYSEKDDITEALREATEGLVTDEVELLLFTTDQERFHAFSKQVRELFPTAQVMGATSYNAISDHGMAKDAISLLALSGDIRCECGVIHDIARYPMKYRPVVQQCFEKMRLEENLVCFEMMTAFSNAEELVLDTFEVVFEGNVPVIGSSAGAAHRETKTFVCLNGEIYVDSCVFVLMSSKARMHLFLENIYAPTKHQFVATDVDCEQRIVYEFDHKPAVQVVADALSVPASAVPEMFASHPFGRVIENGIYMVEGGGVREEGEIELYARIYNNTRIMLLELGDLERIRKETAAKIHAVCKNPSLALVVTCLSRSRLFCQVGCIDRFFCDGEFKGAFFGIAGYGEQMNGKHLNASMVVAVFE